MLREVFLINGGAGCVSESLSAKYCESAAILGTNMDKMMLAALSSGLFLGI